MTRAARSRRIPQGSPERHPQRVTRRAGQAVEPLDEPAVKVALARPPVVCTVVGAMVPSVVVKVTWPGDEFTIRSYLYRQPVVSTRSR